MRMTKKKLQINKLCQSNIERERKRNIQELLRIIMIRRIGEVRKQIKINEEKTTKATEENRTK